MKNTMAAGAAGLHLHRRRAEVAVDKEEAPTVQREKSDTTSASTSTSTTSHDILLDHHQVALKKAAEPKKNRLLERKPTEDINQSAEAFINKFRRQLLLQRLESIENYEQMLRRGT